MLVISLGAVVWSLWLFWDEITHLRIVREPGVETQAEHPFWLILPGIAALLIASYPFVRLYLAATGYIEPLTFQDLLQTYIHDRSIYISDLARTERTVRDKTFERVTFVGPAVVVFLDSGALYDNVFDAKEAPPEALLLEVPSGTLTVGAIAFKDCIFRHCRFVRIQVMGTKEDIDRLRADVAKHGKSP